MQDIIDFLKNFSEEIKVTILEDNKFTVSESNYKKYTLLRLLHELDFDIQGIGSREFYIEMDGKEFTFQVENFEFECSLPLSNW